MNERRRPSPGRMGQEPDNSHDAATPEAGATRTVPSGRKGDGAQQPGLFPIRTVATRTGVNPITLRAWERRYGLIRPHRTDKGHRLYTARDIELIRQVIALLDQGIAISQVARMVRRRLDGESAPAPAELPWERYGVRMREAVRRFDEEDLDRVYNDALSLYPLTLVTNRLLVPLLRAFGDDWSLGDGRVAEEHFFATFLRNKLGARFHHRPRGRSGPTLLAACLPGEHHELALLLFAVAAQDHGYRLVLLGADMPFGEIPIVAERSRCDAVVLSGSFPGQADELARGLREVTAGVTVPVFVGGQTAVRWQELIIGTGAIAVGQDIDGGLRRIAETLQDREAR